MSLQQRGRRPAGGADHRRAHDRWVGAGRGSGPPDRRRAQREARRPRAGCRRDRRDRTRRAPRAVRGRGQPLAALVGGRGLRRRAPRVARPARLAVGDRRRLHHLSPRGRGGGGARRAVGAPARRARAGWCCRTSMRCAHFAAGYRRWLCQTAAMLLAVAHAVNAALISVFTELTSAQSGTLLALTVPALLLPMLRLVRVAAPPHRRHRTLLRRSPSATRARAGRRGRIPTPSPPSAPRRGCPTGCRATRRWRARSRSSRSR